MQCIYLLTIIPIALFAAAEEQTHEAHFLHKKPVTILNIKRFNTVDSLETILSGSETQRFVLDQGIYNTSHTCEKASQLISFYSEPELHTIPEQPLRNRHMRLKKKLPSLTNLSLTSQEDEKSENKSKGRRSPIEKIMAISSIKKHKAKQKKRCYACNFSCFDHHNAVVFNIYMLKTTNDPLFLTLADSHLALLSSKLNKKDPYHGRYYNALPHYQNILNKDDSIEDNLLLADKCFEVVRDYIAKATTKNYTTQYKGKDDRIYKITERIIEIAADIYAAHVQDNPHSLDSLKRLMRLAKDIRKERWKDSPFKCTNVQFQKYHELIQELDYK